MGDFDKKKAFGIGGVLTGLAGVIAVAANMSEIIQLFRNDKPEKQEYSVSVIESVERDKKETVIEQADILEENYAEVVEEVPPTEPQPKSVYLDSLKATESYSCGNIDDSVQDTIGNTYFGHIIGIGASEKSFTTYYLGGKYKTLSGIIAVNDRSSDKYTGQIVISVDDNTIYSTEEMGRVSIPVEFSISVENCQWLKINKFGRSSLDDYDGTKFILSDWKLEE